MSLCGDGGGSCRHDGWALNPIWRALLYPYAIIDVDGRKQVVRGLRDYPIMQALEVDGRSYVVRQIDRHLLFRELYSPPAEDASFLRDTNLAGFAETYRRCTPGRCIMHPPRCMEQGHCVYLFFDSDGTGFALHPVLRSDIQITRTETISGAVEYERVAFRWDDIPAMTADVLSAPVEQLRGLCETLFEKRINPYLRIPYTYRDEAIPCWWPDNLESEVSVDLPQDIPLSWLSGSEQELRHLSHAICCTEPGLFDVQKPVTVVYRAATQNKRGGFLHVTQGYDHVTSRRLMSLCDLAFRLN